MKNKIIRVKQPDDAPMHLTWIINNICTNACSYCPPDLHAGKNHHYEWENAKRFFDMLFERYPKIHCSVSGGEPSISPFFLDIAKTFHEKGHTIGITSNAAKPAAYWAEIAPYLNYISFSWHPEFQDKNFLEKVLAAATQIPVTVRVMMLPEMWDECLAMFHYFSLREEFFTEAVRIIDHQGSSRTAHVYTPEQIKWFDEHPSNHRYLDQFDHIPGANIGADFYFDDGSVVQSANASDWCNKGFTNFNGYICEIGLKSLVVRADGLVYLGNCLVGGKIGSINKPERILWPYMPVKCNIDLCDCSSDINLNKWID